MRSLICGAAIWAVVMAAPLTAISAPDQDGDGIPDVIDNCMLVPNSGNLSPPNCDADMDGYGNACDPDLTQDWLVGMPDFSVFLNNFNQPGNFADFNCDGFVDINDFPTLLQFFGQPPGPSGLSCAGSVPCP